MTAMIRFQEAAEMTTEAGAGNDVVYGGDGADMCRAAVASIPSMPAQAMTT